MSSTLQFYLIFFFLILTSQSGLAQDYNPNIHVEQLLAKAEKYINNDPNKAFLYLNEALKYKDKISETQLSRLYEITSLAYSVQDSNLLALEYGFKSLEIRKKDKKGKLYTLYNNIGGIYMSLGDTLKAKTFWTKALGNMDSIVKKKNIKEVDFKKSTIYNNLALIEIGEKNYTKALRMLDFHKKYSLKYRDTPSLIISYQNISDVYHELKEYDSSRFYLNRGIHLSQKTNSSIDLSYLYYDKGFRFKGIDNDSAFYYLHKSLKLAEDNSLNNVKLHCIKALAGLYESKNDFRKSSYYWQIAYPLAEEENKQQNKKKVQLIEFEKEQKIKQQEALADTQRRESIYIFGFILLVPLSFIVFLMYRLQKTKANKRRVEIEFLIQKMEAKNKELTSNALQMLQANEIIDSTHKELSHLRALSDKPTNQMLNRIITDLKSGAHSFNKKEFEKLFMETEEAFYKKLLHQFPTLTSNEIRLCAFAKMNFSTKEISAITKQSNNSIQVARTRLRKKMGLDENQSLMVFLKNF